MANTNRGTGLNQNAALFNYPSLGGNLTVDQLTGPMLFTPVPLSASSSASEITSPGNSLGNSQLGQGQEQSQSLGQPVPGYHVPGSIDRPQIPTGVQPTQEVPLLPVQTQDQPFSPPTYPSQNVAFQPQQPSYGASPGLQFPSDVPQQFTPFAGSAPQQINQYQAPGVQYAQDSFSVLPPGQDIGSSNTSPPSSLTRPTQVVPPQPQLQQPTQQPQQFPSTAQPGQPVASFVPVQPHWFFLKNGRTWTPFSYLDSKNLEVAYQSHGNIVVPTDGGRYDTDLDTLTRGAIYWKEQPCMVRRCTWFYKGDAENKLVPYEENIAQILEREYQSVFSTNAWNKKVDLPRGECVVFHNANVIVHYRPSNEPMDWTGEDSQARPKVVRRGIADIEDEIHEGEPTQVDHVVFCVHGIGPVADLSGRSLVECVDDMRQQALLQMASHHFVKEGLPVGRVEFLPIQWYFGLHNDKSGVDDRLKAVTLGSIGKFRQFTNDTLTDILFFTSPMYCQTICDTVASEMNRMLQLFRNRNPTFQGGISVLGHSLGSCILFDILANQEQDGDGEEEVDVTEELIETNVVVPQASASSEVDGPSLDKKITVDSRSSPAAELDSQSDEIQVPDIETVLSRLGLQDLSTKFQAERMDTETLMMCSEPDIKDLGIPMGPRKKLMGFIREQSKLKEQREIEREHRSKLKRESELVQSSSVTPSIQLPTTQVRMAICKGTQTRTFKRNCSVFTGSASIEIAYEKGLAGTGQPHVDYPKLDFHPTNLFALGSPISLFLTTRGVSSFGLEFKLPTCPSFLNIFHPYDPVAYRIEPLVNPDADFPPVLIPHHKGRKRFHLELRENIKRVGANLRQGFIEAVRSTWTSINEFARAHRSDADLQLETGEETTETAIVAPLQSLLNESTTDGAESAPPEKHVSLGNLNRQRRIDYVLQERPFEIINEYLFALSSHTCYWSFSNKRRDTYWRIYCILRNDRQNSWRCNPFRKSEDTALLILREIYGTE